MDNNINPNNNYRQPFPGNPYPNSNAYPNNNVYPNSNQYNTGNPYYNQNMYNRIPPYAPVPKPKDKGIGLIIGLCIAIPVCLFALSILIGILAPQYLKYVEKSRLYADKDMLDAIYNSCIVASENPNVSVSFKKGTSFTLEDAEDDEDLKDWYKEVCKLMEVDSISDIEFRSKEAKDTPVYIQIDEKGKISSVVKGNLTIPE